MQCSKWTWPEINGLWEFKGKLVHTACWYVIRLRTRTWLIRQG